ncbi:MAG TPA: hypothetical protein VFD59_05250 [Nocardioidaceae bacterium]|nr:hypothetical protein [Nocardioidaceae bacterium]
MSAVFACSCMVGAGLVLVSTDRRFLPAALIQLSAPLPPPVSVQSNGTVRAPDMVRLDWTQVK